MTVGLSPDDAREYRRRWAAVTAREREEQAASTLGQKLDELERLMLSVDDFGWRSSLDDDAPVPLAGQSCASDYSSRQPQSSFMAVPRVTGPLLQAIAATTAWLKQANTSAAVIGGVAASLLGRPRVQKTWT